ncbi:MAG TPA: glycine cleavage system protein GcvH [Terriglobales bacterium]|jgi:glycine cleavage system H protein|nr:glycine cleavage system protein GcvH [Terriglobales bacterium]
MAFPADYRYTREHEWIKLDGNQATIGITDYAQNSLGDIVFVELPKIGDELSVGKTFGSVESVKAVSDLFAPASGKVVAVNQELTNAPEKINSDAHGAWIVRIQLSDADEVNKLLSPQDYDKYVQEEGGH